MWVIMWVGVWHTAWGGWWAACALSAEAPAAPHGEARSAPCVAPGSEAIGAAQPGAFTHLRHAKLTGGCQAHQPRSSAATDRSSRALLLRPSSRLSKSRCASPHALQGGRIKRLL